MTAQEILDAMKNDPMYDFREEIVKFDTTNPLDKHAIYQAIGIAEKKARFKPDTTGLQEAQSIYEEFQDDGKIHSSEEADRCDLLQNIFRSLYGEDFLLEHCGQIAGDFMNSTTTTLSELLKPNYWKEIEEFTEKRWGKVTTVCLYRRKRRIYRKALSDCRGATEFLRVSYTLGNFIPVPRDCNCYGAMMDYWDLKLQCIYNWYQNGQKREDIEALFTGKKTSIDQYITWLSAFEDGEIGGWNNYVIKNFLQDFVNQTQPEKGYGPPKELWEGHFSGKVKPKDDQIEEFFTNAAACISARSCRMVIALRAKAAEEKQ